MSPSFPINTECPPCIPTVMREGQKQKARGSKAASLWSQGKGGCFLYSGSDPTSTSPWMSVQQVLEEEGEAGFFQNCPFVSPSHFLEVSVPKHY